MVESATETQGIWSTVREAIRGTKQDLTAIPVRRAIVLLAVPTVLEMSPAAWVWPARCCRHGSSR